MFSLHPELSRDSALVAQDLLIKSGNSAATQSLLVIPSSPTSEIEAHRLVQPVGESFRTITFTGTVPEGREVFDYARELGSLLLQGDTKRLNVLGIGVGTRLAMLVAVVATKIVRHVVLVNPITRDMPTQGMRIASYLDRFLPAGLPARVVGNPFDARATLHRISCPTLLITDDNADSYIKSEVKFASKRIPNSWEEVLQGSAIDGSGQLHPELCRMTTSFCDVAVKRPQKNKAAKALRSEAQQQVAGG